MIQVRGKQEEAGGEVGGSISVPNLVLQSVWEAAMQWHNNGSNMQKVSDISAATCANFFPAVQILCIFVCGTFHILTSSRNFSTYFVYNSLG